jgi:hypothetical protein
LQVILRLHDKKFFILGSNEEIQNCIKNEIDELFDKYKDNTSNLKNDTFIYPFLQMGIFKVEHEVQFLKDLLNNKVFIF